MYFRRVFLHIGTSDFELNNGDCSDLIVAIRFPIRWGQRALVSGLRYLA
jgi:hypothetical protein